jgi:hypothetical protein
VPRLCSTWPSVASVSFPSLPVIWECCKAIPGNLTTAFVRSAKDCELIDTDIIAAFHDDQ